MHKVSLPVPLCLGAESTNSKLPTVRPGRKFTPVPESPWPPRVVASSPPPHSQKRNPPCFLVFGSGAILPRAVPMTAPEVLPRTLGSPVPSWPCPVSNRSHAPRHPTLVSGHHQHPLPLPLRISHTTIASATGAPRCGCLDEVEDGCARRPPCPLTARR